MEISQHNNPLNMKHIIIVLLFFLSASPLWALDEIDDRLFQHAATYTADSIVLTDLVAHLVEVCETESEKAEIIYYWIAQNIAYDIDGYLDGSYQTDTIKLHCLQTKVGVCENYADLYQAMAKQAGLEAYVVHGYAKGLGRGPSDNFYSMNHAWNIVKVGDTYRFVDSCWGSGIVILEGELVAYLPKIQLQYVLRKPSSMLESHLPGDPLWQFSKAPIDMKAFLGEGSSTYLNYSRSNPYPVAKKLKAFQKLNSYGQEIVSNTRAYKFHPIDANVERLMIAYQYAGYSLLQSKFDEEKIHRGISFYKRSAQLVNKLEIESIRAQMLKEDAKRAIKYGYHRLNTRF